MQRQITGLVLGALVVMVPLAAPAQAAAKGKASSDATQTIENLVIEMADSPAEHEALAKYFEERASGVRAEAKKHRSMAESYRARPRPNLVMKQHCERIASLNEELATHYEALAEEERAAAKR